MRKQVKLSTFVAQRRDAILEHWSDKVVRRLGLPADRKPLLLNDLPELLGDIVEALDRPPEEWSSTSARAHARQRISIGVDIGGLSEEICIVGEAILELLAEEGVEPDLMEVAAMNRILARGAAESVTEYARVRDRQVAVESARHFSFVAHELRTPLQTARLCASLIAEQSDDSTLMRRLERAHQKLTDLIDNSLVEARLALDPEVDKEPVDSTELVAAALEAGAGLAEQRDIELVSSCEAFRLQADRKLLVSALSNLVINGIKFSERGRRVSVRAITREERVHFEVEDGCGGLSEDAMTRMFQPFAQAGKDRSGFGIGLMIVKQAIEAHGGSVRAVNRPGDGCCFIAELPRHRTRDSRA